MIRKPELYIKEEIPQLKKQILEILESETKEKK